MLARLKRWILMVFGLLVAACGEIETSAPPDPDMGACIAGGMLAEFPWPPPQYSVAQTVPRAVLLGNADPSGMSLEEVADRIEAGLDAAGYIERGFYGIGCDGFAIVTRLEAIEPDGVPVDGGERFDPADDSRPFSLASYVAQLFYAPPGFYRQITFVVTPRAIRGDGGRTSQEDLDQLLEEGEEELPGAFATVPFTPRHDVTALVYEFRAEGSRDAEAIIPGRLNGAAHLEASGIARGLETAVPG